MFSSTQQKTHVMANMSAGQNDADRWQTQTLSQLSIAKLEFAFDLTADGPTFTELTPGTSISNPVPLGVDVAPISAVSGLRTIYANDTPTTFGIIVTPGQSHFYSLEGRAGELLTIDLFPSIDEGAELILHGPGGATWTLTSGVRYSSSQFNATGGTTEGDDHELLINVPLVNGQYKIEVKNVIGANVSYELLATLTGTGIATLIQQSDPNPCLDGGVLDVPGTSNTDDIDIDNSGNNLSVTVNGQTVFVDGARVTQITSNLGNGNDDFDAAGIASPICVWGDSGSDTITTGDGDDRLEGGDGADVMTGGPGQDDYFVEGALTETSPKDEVIDDIIRNNFGIGDFDGDGAGDSNELTFVSNGDGWINVKLGYDAPLASGTFDFNVDGDDGTTMKLMEAAIDELFRVAAGGVGTYDSQWDFDDDEDVDDITDVDLAGTDIEFFITEILGTFFGGVTLDGKVENADFNEVGSNWQAQVLINHWGIGDMNADGIVDAIDLNLVGINIDQSNGNWP